MTDNEKNFDPAEQQKFDSIAASWWDPDGESRPLHDLNPARLAYIAERARLKGANVIDVGCGGGILSESLAGQGANVTGIDIATKALSVARLHLHESGCNVDYQHSTAESWAERHPSEHLHNPRGLGIDRVKLTHDLCGMSFDLGLFPVRVNLALQDLLCLPPGYVTQLVRHPVDFSWNIPPDLLDRPH